MTVESSTAGRDSFIATGATPRTRVSASTPSTRRSLHVRVTEGMNSLLESVKSATGSKKPRTKKYSLAKWDGFNTVSFPTDEARDWKATSHVTGEEPGVLAFLGSRLVTWFIPAMIAFLTASSGVLIEKASDRLNGLLFGYCKDGFLIEPKECQEAGAWVSWGDEPALGSLAPHMKAWAAYALIAVFLAAFSAFLVRFFAPTARGSGIPEVKTILGGFVMKEVLEFKTLVVKVIGLAFSVSSGMALGKEGPLVHVACCWANFCSKLSPRYMRNEGKRRELISTAAAAGVAVAFGAPVGGVLFSYEEVSTMFPNRTMIRCFFAAVIAALTLLWYNPTGQGKLTMFESATPDMPSIIEFPWFVLLGIVGGMLGALFVRWNIKISANRAEGTPFRKRVPIILEVSFIALITAITSFPSLYTRNLSSVTINALFHTCEDDVGPRPYSADMMGLCNGNEPAIHTALVQSLLLAAAVRFLQMTVTFGTGVPCGLFVPSLYTGACLGRCLGIAVQWMYIAIGWPATSVHPGVYAMVGAAAVLGGVCRVTISLVVIMYELTSALQLVVPFMMAVLTSKFVGDYFNQGIYDRCIELRQYPYLHEPDEYVSEEKAASIMDDDVECLYVDVGTLGEVMEKATSTHFGGFPLVRSATDATLLGYVHTSELRAQCIKLSTSGIVKDNARVIFASFMPQEEQAPNALDFSPLVDQTILRIDPQMAVSQVHTLFRQLGLKIILVAKGANLVGIITKKCFLHHLHILEGHSTTPHEMIEDTPDDGDEDGDRKSTWLGGPRVRPSQAPAQAPPSDSGLEKKDVTKTRLSQPSQNLESLRLFVSAFNPPAANACVEVDETSLSPKRRPKKSLGKWGNFTTVSVPTDSVRDFQDHLSTVRIAGTNWDKLCTAVVPWLIPALVGFLTATSGSLVEVAADLLNQLRFGFCTSNILRGPETCVNWTTWGEFGMNPFFAYITVSVLFAITSALLVWAFAPTARGSGIPEVKTILGGFVMKDVLEMKTLVVKVIGLALSVSSGMALGKEGPLVHVACCWANWCSKLSKRYVENESKRREVISTAAAAGVSVAFGTPLGGVLFSYEEVSTIFTNTIMTRAFFAAVVAALSLRWWDPTGTGKLTMFEAHFVEMPAFEEYPFFILLGVVGGILGAIFVHANITISAYRADGTPFRKRVHIVVEVALLALITAITSWPSEFTRGMSSATIRSLFQTCGRPHEESIDMTRLCDPNTGESVLGTEILMSLGIAAGLRFLQMSCTFGTGVPCGLFVPSLYTGACIGRAAGVMVAALNSHYHFTTNTINPGVYAMIGAASVLGGVCRVTISLVVIMFGLTNALQLIVPFMLALITAKVVGDLFSEGIYDAVIVLRGYPYLHEPGEESFGTACEDIMDTKIQCLNSEVTTFGEVKKIIDETPHGGLPLVTSSTDHTLLGYIHTARLKSHLETASHSALVTDETPVVFKKKLLGAPADALNLSKFVDTTVLSVPPEMPLAQIHCIFWRLGVKLVLIAKNGRLCGMITKKSFVDHMMESHHGHDDGHKKASTESLDDCEGGLSAPLLAGQK